MRVTVNLLNEYNACTNGVEFFEQNFPDGADIIDIINFPKIDIEFLHWGASNLNYTDEEYQAYLNKIHNINSSCIYWCDHAVDSSYCTESSYIVNSHGIHASRNVEDSINVFSSSRVYKSFLVDGSRFVFNSRMSCNSKNVNNSCNILISTSVWDSTNIHSSSDIKRSHYIDKCNCIEDSWFCSNSSYLTNCLFCNGLEGGSNRIFNKPADPEFIKAIKEQLLLFNIEPLRFTSIIDKDYDLSNYIISKPNLHYEILTKRMYKDCITDEVYDWMQSLPNYDPKLMYIITEQSVFLFDENNKN